MKFQNPFFGANHSSKKEVYKATSKVMRKLGNQTYDIRIRNAKNPDIHALLDEHGNEIGIQWFDGEERISDAIHISNPEVMKEVKKNILEFIQKFAEEKRR